MEPCVDPGMLPLPSALQGKSDKTRQNHPVEFLSVIFNQREQNEVLQISKMAKTPMWLKKNMYTKLQSEIEFTLAPINRDHLLQRYSVFDQALKNRQTATPEEANALTQLKQKA